MIHSETYRVRNYETDSRGQLSLFALANYLQDTADRHAIELGVGMPVLAKVGLSWVLHRMKINIIRWPRITEEITIKTQPSGLERVFVYRDFRLYDQEENLIGTATSTWLVFDTNKRGLTPPQSHFQSIFDPYRELAFLPRSNRKLVSIHTSATLTKQVEARHNEIDTNDHVNNSVYFQWLLEPLSGEFLNNHSFSEIEIQFKKECTRQNLITSVCTVPDNGEANHWLLDEAGQEMALGVTRW